MKRILEEILLLCAAASSRGVGGCLFHEVDRLFGEMVRDKGFSHFSLSLLFSSARHSNDGDAKRTSTLCALPGSLEESHHSVEPLRIGVYGFVIWVRRSGRPSQGVTGQTPAAVSALCRSSRPTIVELIVEALDGPAVKRLANGGFFCRAQTIRKLVPS